MVERFATNGSVSESVGDADDRRRRNHCFTERGARVDSAGAGRCRRVDSAAFGSSDDWRLGGISVFSRVQHVGDCLVVARGRESLDGKTPVGFSAENVPTDLAGGRVPVVVFRIQLRV